MLLRIKIWLQNKLIWITSSYTLGIVFMSLINPNKLPSTSISISDKLLHTLAYAILILLWLSIVNLKSKLKVFFAVFLSLTLFGIILEVLQAWITTYRTADWADVIANTVGLIIGSILFELIRFKQKKPKGQHLL